MLFNSWAYLAFLPAVFALHWLVLPRHRPPVLLLASAVFYGLWDARFLGLMGLSILVDYVAARRMGDAGLAVTDQARRRWLLLSVATNLGILGVFKYFDFFSLSLSRLLHTAGLDRFADDPLLLNVVLPVGVSFYTFQSMAYTIDVYRRKIASTRNLLHFALYVSFFPQLVAGPIERAKTLLPQLIATRRLRDVRWRAAWWLLAWGLFKKLVIADNLSPLVGRCLDTDSVTGPTLFVGLLLFAFQILCDFSGYTDLARGSALLFGIELRPNFKLPYFAVSPSDFWRRWHISLSSWLRDYLYISLGGNRGSQWQTKRNLLLTMLLGGLWHGAAWNFVLWGAYHGLLLVLYQAAERTRVWSAGGGLGTVFRSAGFFLLTLIGWGFFRAQQPGQLTRFSHGLLDWTITDPQLLVDSLRDFGFLVAPLLLVMAIEKRREFPANESRSADKNREFGESLHPFGLASVVLFLLGAVAIWGATGGTEFLYFQF